MRLVLLIIFFTLTYSCDFLKDKNSILSITVESSSILNPSLVILGTTQDAGSPQIACAKDCCRDLVDHPDELRKIVSLGLVLPKRNETYLFEATPDIVSQMKLLKNLTQEQLPEIPNGIFITHAHIGHYTGLMYFGKEAMSSSNIPVFAMPRLKSFLETNGPWDNLVSNNNIAISLLTNDSTMTLTDQVYVTPFLVPHRDEYSETVGYTIAGPNKTALFIPDIDKWSKWDKDIVEEIKSVDYAFVDATFYDGEEINNRDISLIPHPFVIESMRLFEKLTRDDKRKVVFIHFNHTNSLLNPHSDQSKEVLKNGYRIAKMGDVFEL